MEKKNTLTRILRSTLAALLPWLLMGCTEPGRALIAVDVVVKADVDQSALRTIALSVVDGEGGVLSASRVPAPDEQVTTVKLGVYLDVSGVTTVAVSAVGLDADDALIARAAMLSVTVQPGVKSEVVTLVLGRAEGGPAVDGATDTPDAGVSPKTDGPAAGDTAPLIDAPVNPNPSWSPAVNQEDDLSASSSLPVVASHPANGDAVVAWAERNGVKARFYRAASATWGDIRRIELRTRPQGVVAGIDASGRITVAWSLIPLDTVNPDDVGVWTSQSTDGNNWTPPQRLYQGETWGENAVAVSASGAARLVWVAAEKAGDEVVRTVWSAAFLDGVWGAGTRIRQASDDDERYPRVAINSQDEGVIMWVQPEDGASTFEESIWAATFDGASVASPALLETNTDRNFDPYIALNDDGRGVALWTRSGNTGGLFARVFTGTTFLPEATIDTAYAWGEPAAAVDRQGNIAVLVARSEGSVGMNVHYTALPVGGAWSAPVPLETTNGAEARTDHEPYPQVHFDAQGNLVATWRRKESPNDNFTWGVWAARKRAGESWSSPEKIAGIDKLRAMWPAFDLSANGVGVAAWIYVEDDNAMLMNAPSWQVFTTVWR